LKRLLLLLLLGAAAVIAWGILRKSSPRPVSFARAKRQTLISTLPTNGKVEPFEWQAVRAEAAGLVVRVPVREGQGVFKGGVVAEISDPALAADIEAAEARVAEARANLAALEAGGKPAELTDIENSIARARFDLNQAKTEHDALKRLADKQAATTAEVRAARDRIEQTQMLIDGLEKRRQSLVSPPDVVAAQARLQDAESALKLARDRAAQSFLRAPIAGVVYGVAARPGAYVNPGDLVANVGRLDRLRVRVYVDEPELGRVAEGQPVTITWQALPGKQWNGIVERKPSSIEALGSRQVGQIICTIENPGRELIPGTNVDALIRTAVVEDALVIPKEALRHDSQGDYVLAFTGDTVERRAVKTGHASAILVEIVHGLAAGDAVALSTEAPIKPGDRVKPVG